MNKIGLSAALVLSSSSIALATAPIPAPIAGAFGPAGFAVAGAAYLGYRIWKKRSD